MKNLVICLILSVMLFISCDITLEDIQDYFNEEDPLVYSSEVYRVLGGTAGGSQMLAGNAGDLIVVENGDTLPLVFNVDPAKTIHTFLITNTGNAYLTVSGIQLHEVCGGYALFNDFNLPHVIIPGDNFYFRVETVVAIDTVCPARVGINIVEEEELFVVHFIKKGYSLSDSNNNVLLNHYDIDIVNTGGTAQCLAVHQNIVENVPVYTPFKYADLNNYSQVVMVGMVSADSIGRESFNKLYYDFIAYDSSIAYSFEMLFFVNVIGQWGQFVVVFDCSDFNSNYVETLEIYTVDGDGNALVKNVVIVGVG